MKIDLEKLNQIANGEIDALIEGLEDPDTRNKPQFLAAVRKFLKDNQLETQPEEAAPIMKITKDLPVFNDVDAG